jgi:hypothetical protein
MKEQHHAKKCIYCHSFIENIYTEELLLEKSKIHLQECPHTIFCTDCSIHVQTCDLKSHFKEHDRDYVEIIQHYQSLLDLFQEITFFDKKRHTLWIQKTIQILRRQRIGFHEKYISIQHILV